MKDSHDILLADYRKDCEVQGITIRTIDHYYYCLRYFSSFLKERKVLFKDVKKNHIIEYIMYLRNERSFKAKTLENHFSALNSFYDFLIFNEAISSNLIPTLRKRYLKRYKKQDGNGYRRKVINPREMASYLNSILNPRDKAIATLLIKTGVRRGELISIDIEDVNWKDMSITLKGKRKRTNTLVFFDGECAKVLKQWLKIRESLYIQSNCHALFIGQHGGRLKRKGVYEAVVSWAKKKGFYEIKSDDNANHFSPHNLRHCFTTYLLENGMNREYVQELRGDARRDAVDIYHHIQVDKLREAYLAAMPQFGL